MNHLELVREATRIAHHVKAEGDLTFDDLFPEADLEDVAALYLTADEWRKTADLVVKVVSAHLYPLLTNRSVEVGGTLLWRGESKREVCVDGDGFINWAVAQLDSNPRAIHNLFNPTYARKGGLPPAVRETFFEKQSTGKVEVQQAPIEVIEQARQKRAANE